MNDLDQLNLRLKTQCPVCHSRLKVTLFPAYPLHNLTELTYIVSCVSWDCGFSSEGNLKLEYELQRALSSKHPQYFCLEKEASHE